MKSKVPSLAHIHELYGDKIRVRACGVLIQENKILLLKHEKIGPLGYFWNVPGGSPEEGESLTKCLEREYEEEVELKISVGKFLHLNEYIAPPLHAVECYFQVEATGGVLKLGKDPEMDTNQILSAYKWMSKSEMLELPKEAIPQFIDQLWTT